MIWLAEYPPAGGGSSPLPIALVAAGVVIVAAWAAYVMWRRASWAWRRVVRSRRVELAAEEAAFSEPEFAPELVKAAAVELQAEVIAAWAADDRHRLADLMGHELFTEWCCRLQDLQRKRWRHTMRPRRRTRVRYVGLLNRTDDKEERVVVHLRTRMDDVIADDHGQIVLRSGNDKRRSTHSEYWTLARRAGRWIVVSIENEWEGAHHLTDPIVASPCEDERLHDRAVVERAAHSTLPAPTLESIVPLEFPTDLRMAALDLAAFDGRYAPDVIEASVHEAMAAWAEAIDGDHRRLIALAGASAVTELLQPDRTRRTRLVIRGPQLQRLRILALEPKAEPPMMTVEATITGRRYVEHRANGVVLLGSKDYDTTFTVRWDLVLNEPETPWRITRTHSLPRPAIGRLRVALRDLTQTAFDMISQLLDRPSS